MVNDTVDNVGHTVTRKGKYGIDSIISWLLFALIFFLIINAALPQLEMLFFSGRVPIPSVTLKLCIVMLLVVYAMIHADRVINKASTLMLISLFFLFIVETALLSVSSHYPLTVIIFGYNTMYSLLIIALLMTNFRSTIGSCRAGNVLLIISVPLVLLGIAQAIMNEPLVPLRSVDDYFQVLVWNYYGQVRAFSLFEAPAYYATFLIFFGGFVLGNALSWRRRKVIFFYLSLFALVTLSEFMSLNRTAIFAYIFVSFTIISVYKMRYGKDKLILIMGVSFLSSIVLVLGVPLVSKTFPFVFAFKDQSMLERYAEWQYWIHFLLRSPQSVLFGSGVFQNSLFGVTKGVIVDNMFLAVLVQFGVMGLAIVLYVIYMVWSIVVARHLNVSSPMAIASIALLTVWPIFSMFGTGLNIFPIYAAIPFLLKADNKDDPHVRHIVAAMADARD